MEKMRERFDAFLMKEIKIGKIEMQSVVFLFGICISIAGILIRFSLRHFISGDMDGALLEWVTCFEENGGLKALRLNFSCYNPPYMYILCLISYIDYPTTPFSYMYYIKAFSVLFDYAAAYVMFLIIYRISNNSEKAMLAYSAVLLCPTVILNSAAWGQCDIVYVVFLMLCFYYVLCNKSTLALAFMGLAFSIKLQAGFFLPFLVICWLKKKVKLMDFLMIPAIYLITSIPAVIAGQGLGDIINIYLGQPGFYDDLVKSYPNIYALIEENQYTAYLIDAAPWLTIGLLGGLMLWVYTQKFHMTCDILSLLVLVSVSIIVYCMPHMHERYGFILDIFAIVYCFASGALRRYWIMLAYEGVSFVSYLPYLFRSEKLTLIPIAIFYGILIVYIGMLLFKRVAEEGRSEV